MNKNKFYYDNETKIIRVEPFNHKEEITSEPYIELTFTEWQEKLSSCPYGYKKAFINGEIIEVEDTTLINTNEYQNALKQAEISDLKTYLNSTDYVVLKLNELKEENEEEYLSEKERYSNVLENRRLARNRINILEGEIK